MTVDVTCSECGTALELRYTFVLRRPVEEHPLGCPECQSTGDVRAAVAQLEEKHAHQFFKISALSKKTEIGLGAARPPKSTDGTPGGVHVERSKR